MSYYDQSLLARDPDFRERIAACAATEEQSGADLDDHPTAFADREQWAIAAAPGFAAAYSYALETGVEHPGRDVSVISDAQLLSAVQAILQPPPPPEPK